MTSMRRAALPVAATLAAACLLAPAMAVESPAADEEIAFGSTEADAPVVAPGRYQFTMPEADSDNFLSVERKIPRSTIWVAQTLVSSGTKNGYLYYDATGADSKNRCGDEGGSFEGDDYIGHQFMTGILEIGKGPCLKEDRVDLSYRPFASGEDSKVPSGEKGQLVVWEEPPVKDASLLPPPSSTQAWDGSVLPAKGEAKLGTSYADAPDLTGGRYEGHIDPGVPALFAVPLDWGQHLELSLQYKGAEYKDYVPIEAVLVTPLGGDAKWAKTEDGPTFSDVNLKYPSMDGGVTSPTITWRNREKPSSNPAAFPGTYYVMLKMGTKDAPKKGADLTLGVNVITDKAADSPYAEAPAPLPDISGKEAAPTGDDPAKGGSGAGKETASDSSTDSTPWGAVTALFGGSAVMAAAGALSLGRYRKVLR
ncbi:MAG: hypothetical protein ABWX84_01930 [Nocardioides sp.]